METGKILLRLSLIDSLQIRQRKQRTHDNPDPTSGPSHESQQSHLWPKNATYRLQCHVYQPHTLSYLSPRILSPLLQSPLPFSLLHSHIPHQVSPSLLRHTVQFSMSDIYSLYKASVWTSRIHFEGSNQMRIGSRYSAYTSDQ